MSSHYLVSVNGRGIGDGFHQADADYSRPGELAALWMAAVRAQRYYDAGWGAFDTNTFVHTIVVDYDCGEVSA